jgi:hypothetical protein
MRKALPWCLISPKRGGLRRMTIHQSSVQTQRENGLRCSGPRMRPRRAFAYQAHGWRYALLSPLLRQISFLPRPNRSRASGTPAHCPQARPAGYTFLCKASLRGTEGYSGGIVQEPPTHHPTVPHQPLALLVASAGEGLGLRCPRASPSSAHQRSARVASDSEA